MTAASVASRVSLPSRSPDGYVAFRECCLAMVFAGQYHGQTANGNEL
jgi:hypothetical protein